MLDDVGLGAHKQGVKQWYDGFTFGRYTDIYNPWSIASFIRNKGKYEAGLIAEGFAPGQIRKYGFAFQGKKCLIG